MRLIQFLLDSCKTDECKDKIALIAGSEKFTYEKLLERIVLIQQNLPEDMHNDLVVVEVPSFNESFFCECLILILTVMSMGCAVYPVNNQSYLEGAAINRFRLDFKAKWVITSNINSISSSSEYFLKAFEIGELSQYFYLYSLSLDGFALKDRIDFANIAYVAQSSGSTGTPKIIKVPHECICPNIDDLAIIIKDGHKLPDYSFTKDSMAEISTILMAPLTFDPCWVEMFSVWKLGGTVHLIDKILKLNSTSFINYVATNRITHLTITPSLWNTMPPNCQILLLKSVRILFFGGEVFPLNSVEASIKELLEENFNLLPTIYNLYGTTEMSCWASISQYDPSHPSFIFCIGTPLSQTNIHFEPANIQNENGNDFKQDFTNLSFKIMLHSLSRVCIINETRKCAIDTGDLALNCAERGFVFQGRKDFCIKRKGHILNLEDLESFVSHFMSGSPCIFVVLQNSVLEPQLVVYVATIKEPSIDLIVKAIYKKYGDVAIPDFVAWGSSYIPLTHHAKADRLLIRRWVISSMETNLNSDYPRVRVKPALKSNLNDIIEILYKHAQRDHINYFLDEFYRLIQLFLAQYQDEFNHHMTRPELQSTYFLQLVGASSFKATLLTHFLISLLPKSSSEVAFKTLHRSLMSQPLSTVVMELWHVLVNESHIDAIESLKPYQSCSSNTSFALDLKDCVDCRPVLSIYEKGVYTASHGGLFARIKYSRLGNPSIAWQFQVSGRHIEASCCESARTGCVFVGNHDGNYYALEIASGNMKWQAKLGDFPIKVQGLVNDSTGTVWIGSYDGTVFELDQDTGTVKSKFDAGGSIIGICKLDHKTIISVSTKGTLSTNFGWSTNLGRTILVSPASFDCSPPSQGVLWIGAVDGTVWIVDSSEETPSCLLVDQLSGPIFSMPLPISITQAIVVCHNGLVTLVDRSRKSLQNINLETSVGTSAFKFTANTFGVLSIDGKLHVLSVHDESLRLVSSKYLIYPAGSQKVEIFSTPCYDEDAELLVFGGRDSHVHFFKRPIIDNLL